MRAIVRQPGPHINSTTGKTISGARFGRIKIARPAAIPDRAAEAYGRFHHANTSDTFQNAAAGTSLMGHSVISRIVGLLAVNSAASAPVARPETCTPSAKVERISTAPASGVMMNAPQLPSRVMNTAIRSGKPGAYVGTIVWLAPGRYPSGVKLQSALGHGTSAAKSWWT